MQAIQVYAMATTTARWLRLSSWGVTVEEQTASDPCVIFGLFVEAAEKVLN